MFLAVALCVSTVCLIVAQAWMEIRDPMLLAFAGYTALYIAYQAVSLPVNFAGRSFDLAAHEAHIRAWRPRHRTLHQCRQETQRQRGFLLRLHLRHSGNRHR